MFTKKDKNLYVHLLKISILVFFLALSGIRFLSSSAQAYAATGKGGAELLVDGKVVKLTPVSSSRPARPHASQECAFVSPSETDVSNDGTEAYFKYSLRIDNRCSGGVAITAGRWNAQGSVQCDGEWYDNPPSDNGNIPSINSGRSAFVRDQVPFKAVCVGEALDFIPYLYVPEEIEIATTAAGNLSNGNTWADAETDYFIP
jgi:hypothetical protein